MIQTPMLYINLRNVSFNSTDSYDCFYETIGSVCEEQVDALICEVVKSLSPVKRSKNNTAYFHGELADSTGHIQLFGYNCSQAASETL